MNKKIKKCIDEKDKKIEQSFINNPSKLCWVYLFCFILPFFLHPPSFFGQSPTENRSLQSISSTINNAISSPNTTVSPNTQIIVEEPDLYDNEMEIKMSHFPPKPPSQYPDINIDGFYEGKISGRDYNPKLGDGLSTTDPLWHTIRNDSVYNKLPQDVLLGDPKLEIRYKFNIDGKLDDDLSVHYDIEQEPEFPGKYDIEVQYKKNKLTFYHFDAKFEQGEFININKALNGAMFESENSDWETRIATGRLRSTPQKYSSFGNGKKEISIGRTNILYGSVMAWKNNRRIHEGKDFTVNYFQGTVTFKNAPTTLEFVEIVYEFTNPIEDFIPVLNRKNFLGMQYKWKSKKIITKEKVKQNSSETFKIPTENILQGPQNIFYTKNNPIVLGSDVVKLNSRVLQKNEDYFLKTHSGKLKIINYDFTPSDNLSISYDYYLKETYSEDIIAENSPGWYKLKKNILIDGTVSVFIDDKKVQEAIDYIIDYDAGRIQFNYTVFYPQVISISYEAIKTEVETSKEKSSPIEVGVTYLNEYVKTEEQELSQSVSSENVIVSKNSLTVQNNPLTSTSDITIETNNTIMPDNSYDVDLYTGKITFKDAAQASSALVSYKYNKSFKTQYQFSISRDDKALEYTNNIYPGFNLKDTPVKNDGVLEIRIQKYGKDLLRLTPNRDFTIDYAEDGQGITLRFIEKNSDNDSILERENIPDRGDVITLIYNFTPNKSSGSGNIDQKMFGVTLGANLTKKWKVNTEIAAASNNFSKPEVDVIGEEISGSGISNADYNLPNSNLVENSESIVITAKGRTLTKGRDYIINYQSGKIKFINLTPSANDKILVDYKYYDNSGVFETGSQSKLSYATKLSTEYEFDDISFKGNFKSIDREYAPLSTLQGSNGHKSFGGSTNWKINNIDSFSANYQRNTSFVGKKDDNSDAFTNNDVLNTTTKIRLFDHFDTTQTTAYNKTIQDPLTTLDEKNLHATDTESLNYSVGTSLGPQYFRNTFSQGLGESNTDILDKISPTQTKTRSFSYSSKLFLKNLFLLGDTNIDPSYSTNLSRVLTTTSPHAETGGITENISISNTESKGINTQIKPLQSLIGRFNYSTNKSSSYKTGEINTTKNVNQSQNKLYSVGYNPYTWINTNYQHTQSETESPLVNIKNNRATNTSYSIGKFGPRGFLGKVIRMKRNGFIGNIIGDSFFTYGKSKAIDLKDNDKNRSFSDSENWSYRNTPINFDQILPIKGLSLNNLNYTDSKSKSNNIIETTTETTANISESLRNSQKKSQKGSLNFKPSLPVLNLFSYTINLSKSDDIQDIVNTKSAATGNISVNRDLNFTRSQSLSFNPGQIRVGIPFIFTFGIGTFSSSVGENYLEVVDKNTKRDIPLNSSISPTESITQKDQLKTTYTYAAKIAPFDILTLNGRYTDTDDKNVSDGFGLSYRLKDTISLSTSYTFFNFLTLSGSANQNETKQFTSDISTARLSQLKEQRFLNPRNTTLFKSGLEEFSRNYNANSSLRFFNLLTISGGGSHKRTKSSVYSGTATTTINRFKQYSGNAGTSISPLPGLSIGYNYTISHTYQNNGDKQVGFTGSTTAGYTPIKTKYVNVNVSYTRSDSWGKNFNKLDQDQTIQANGQTLSTKIVETDHTVENASVNININLPLNNSPYVEKLVVTGEGYVKRVQDNLDHQKEQRNSYDVGGIVIKGTLSF